jgi:hypothetical protein
MLSTAAAKHVCCYVNSKRYTLETSAHIPMLSGWPAGTSSAMMRRLDESSRLKLAW